MAAPRRRFVPIALLLATGSLAGLVLLPRWICSPAAEITLRRLEVVNGEGRIHDDVVLPAGTALAVGWTRGGDDQSVVEIAPRWFPGWPRRDSRTLSLGPLNETRMKVKDEFLRALFEKAVTWEWNKTYRMEKNDRLQFARGVLTSWRFELR